MARRFNPGDEFDLDIQLAAHSGGGGGATCVCDTGMDTCVGPYGCIGGTAPGVGGC